MGRGHKTSSKEDVETILIRGECWIGRATAETQSWEVKMNTERIDSSALKRKGEGETRCRGMYLRRGGFKANDRINKKYED